MIFFKDGAVVHAMCDKLSGEDAFFKILSFQGGTLQNIKGVEPPVVSIKKGLESLLFEAAVKNDEDGSGSEEGPAATDAENEPATLEELDSDLLSSTLDVITSYSIIIRSYTNTQRPNSLISSTIACNGNWKICSWNESATIQFV